MDIQNLKLYLINGSTLGVTTLTDIEMGLKVLLLIVTIGYTVTKWVQLKNEKKKSHGSAMKLANKGKYTAVYVSTHKDAGVLSALTTEI